MSLDLWKIESKLYAWIDAQHMRLNSKISKSFDLGESYLVDIKINNFTRKPISNQSIVSTNEFVFSMNFRKNNSPWFRIDNESKDKGESENYLHFHLESTDQKFDKHQKLKELYSVEELISFTFDWVYKIISEKFPKEMIMYTSGFIGTA